MIGLLGIKAEGNNWKSVSFKDAALDFTMIAGGRSPKIFLPANSCYAYLMRNSEDILGETRWGWTGGYRPGTFEPVQENWEVPPREKGNRQRIDRCLYSQNQFTERAGALKTILFTDTCTTVISLIIGQTSFPIGKAVFLIDTGGAFFFYDRYAIFNAFTFTTFLTWKCN